MKKLFKIFVFLIFVGIIGFVAAMFFTSDLSDVANNFFTAIKNGNYQKAEEYVSRDFKESTPTIALKRALPYEKFKNYSGCSFSKRVKNADGTAELEGKVEFSDGSAIRVKISLVKENDQWKINHIVLPQTGIKQSNDDYNKLVHTTMVALVDGIVRNNYSDFYSLTSDNFRKQVPESKLSTIFSRFSSAPIDWENVQNMTPVIREKKRLNNGVLRIDGYYPTSPKHLGFRFEYSEGGSGWKVEGVFLRFE